MRLLFVIAALVFAAAFRAGADSLEWALLVAAVVLVLVAEMLNTALELAFDLVHPEQHQLAKAAKDIAAAAVLVACVGAVAVGAFVFLG